MRTLTNTAKSVYAQTYRQPRFKVMLWDVLTNGAPSIASIIDGSADTSYQLDVTQYVRDGLKIQEPGDRRASRLNMMLTDTTDTFHPLYGNYARFVQTDCLVRVKEGDEQLDESDWSWTFTGHIRGRAGFVLNRQSLRRETAINAYGRRGTPRFLKRRFNSNTYGRNVDYGAICNDVATGQMSLQGSELSRRNASLGKVTQFAANSISDLTPLEAIDKILEAVGLMSDFDGEGKLRYINRDLVRGVDKFYETFDLIGSVEIPANDVDAFNQVKLIGLSKDISENERPNVELARAVIPVGFWRPKHEIEVVWSPDRSVRAKDTYMEIQTSVNDHLMVKVGSEDYSQSTEYGGHILVSIADYVTGLYVLITITLLAQAAIGDTETQVVTIPVGKVLEAATLQLIFLALSVQSSGQYLIKGTALTPVFEQITAEMTDESVADWQVNTKEIRNDWINEQTELEVICELELIFEVAQGLPYRFSVYNDLEIEIGDIVQLPIGGGVRIWIESLSKTLSRGQVPMLEVNGYKAC